MALEMLEKVREAEKNAAERFTAAQNEAREIIKGVEEACLESERRENAEIRILYQQKMEQAEKAVKAELDGMQKEKSTARTRMAERSRANIPQASALIFERIVNNGNR